MTGVLDRIRYAVVHLVQFRWDVDGVPHELNLNTAGTRAHLDTLHVAKLLALSDVVSDNTGPSRLVATLRLTGPHSVRFNDESWVVYESVSALIQAYPEIMATATVKVRMEVRDPHQTSEVKTLITDAEVASCSNCDGLTITFEIEQRNALARTIIPQHTLSKRTVPTAAAKYIDKDTIGSPIPISLGDCLPGLLVDDDTSWWRYKLGVLGLTVPTHPTIRSHKYLSGTEWFDVHLWCEKISGMEVLESDYMGSYIGKALVFSYWKDAAGTDRYGTSVDGSFSEAAGYSTVARSHLSRVRPWVMYPIVPEPVNDDAGEAAAAVDGNTLTYATIQPGHYMEFEVTGGSNNGMISRNSTDSGTDTTDDEGAGAPVGLKVLALLVLPQGGSAPGTSQAVVSFTWPNGSAYKGATGTFTPPSSGHALCQVNVPYKVSGVAIGQPTAGWAGTSFGTWTFKSHPVSGTAAGSENPNYYADNKELPMRIRIANNGAAGQGPIYVVHTALAVGCKLNREARKSFTEADLPASLKFAWKFLSAKQKAAILAMEERLAVSKAEYDADHRVVQDEKLKTSGGYGPWHQGITEDLPPPRLSDVTVCRPSFKDDGSGTYTGSASGLITEPIEMIRMFLEKVCGESVVDDGGFGDYELTRDRMRAWYGGGDQKWKAHFPVLNRSNADSVLAEIASTCMGLQATRLPDGRWAFWNWAPVVGLGDDRFYGGSNADCEIDLDRVVLRQNGMPMVEVGQGDAKSVINDLEITFGSNSHNMATANWELESDDGTGQPWGYLGVVPNSTLTAFDLCDNSKRRYGARPTKRLNLPQIESRIVAQMAGMYYLGRGCRPPRGLRLCGKPKIHDLHPGMIFRISPALRSRLGCIPPFWPSGTTWDQIYWMCLANAQQGDGRFATQNISAVCVPWNLGEEWVPGAGPTIPDPGSGSVPGMYGGTDAGSDPNSPN